MTDQAVTDQQVRRRERSGLARRSAIAASAVLAAIAALHITWAAGSTWPFSDKEALSQTVWGGPASTFPSPAATMAVSGLIIVAILLVTGRAGLWGSWVPEWVFALGSWGVATVLLLRALVLGIPAIGSDAENRVWELALYSPLCLLLAALCAITAYYGRRSSQS